MYAKKIISRSAINRKNDAIFTANNGVTRRTYAFAV